jgi:hypothetical protein
VLADPGLHVIVSVNQLKENENVRIQQKLKGNLFFHDTSRYCLKIFPFTSLVILNGLTNLQEQF